MGVTGLWTVISPTARPTPLPTLNRKRLAVDASIWIYQFLKAVRDKEGNALRNSHVVGFFRRICKLLYFGIKPVFVFDGGAPALKRETVRRRKQRREGRREDSVRTAGRVLALQMERAAEEEQRQRKRKAEGNRKVEEELPGDEELVYVEEIGMGEAERKKGRGEGFKRKDQYHLPDLDVSIAELGAPNDPRIMSQAELEEYARQFHSGEDINLYDFSKIDFESPFFLSLPAGDRYNILNAARLRSRLRMGYSKDQLDSMFPDRMAFSRFQIERVKERNELTQRLMHINGGDEFDINQGGRIAGEKGKEYVLVRNEGVEGGWALGVVSNREGTKQENAIDLDADSEKFSERDEEDNEEFEDVEIEGLNRIPKTWKRKRQHRETDYDVSYEDAAAVIAKKRKAVYDGRREAAAKKEANLPAVPDGHVEDESLFVPQEDDDDLFEDVNIEAPPAEEEDNELQRAIAVSLDKSEDQEPTVQTDTMALDEDDDEGFDMQAALAESRKSKYEPKTNVRRESPKPAAGESRFKGPLPFESMNLGQSLLGKKKAKKAEEDLSGGFERDLGDNAFQKERPAQSVPEWFNAAPSAKDFRNAQSEDKRLDEAPAHVKMSQEKRSTLRRHQTNEVIDLEAEGTQNSKADQIDISSDEDIEAGDGELVPGAEELAEEANDEWQMPEEVEQEHDAQEELRKKAEDDAREERYRLAREIAAENEPQEAKMGDVAEHVKADPPEPTTVPISIPSPKLDGEMVPIRDGQGDARDGDGEWSEPEKEQDEAHPDSTRVLAPEIESDNEDVEWSESEDEQERESEKFHVPGIPRQDTAEDEDEDEEFEDVDIPSAPALQHRPSTAGSIKEARANPFLNDIDDANTLPTNNMPAEPKDNNPPPAAEEDYFSDSDEELMRQLAIEAEEHARFTSSLNNTKTAEQAARDYEAELKQLRNQQKRDRRDADEVTQTMIQECQALLRLFGLPYITAPMEAEAQCAELVHLGLVDGIVTDDSDIFLFGGTRVYKNMFNSQKFVECYLLSDLEKEYALDRRKLIRFAHLLGSDYTEGISGVGPVTALEILTDFNDLQDFKLWCEKIQLGRTNELEGQMHTPFRRKFRNAALKRVFLPAGFPDARVDAAYLKPEVDSDPAEFQWGVPDLDKLRSFLMATIGWSNERVDEVLVPVIRDMNRREVEGTQANITRFFSGAVGVGVNPNPGAGEEGVAGARNRTGKESGRMRSAYKRLRGEAERRREVGGAEINGLDKGEDLNGDDGVEGEAADDREDDAAPAMKSRMKSNGKKKTTTKSKAAKAVDYDEDDDPDNAADEDDYEPPKKSTKGRGARKAKAKA